MKGKTMSLNFSMGTYVTCLVYWVFCNYILFYIVCVGWGNNGSPKSTLDKHKNQEIYTH